MPKNNKITDEILEKKKQEIERIIVTKIANLNTFTSSIFFPTQISNKLLNVLVVVMVSTIIVGLIYALIISPPDYIQGDSVRIMYVHVPSSFLSLGCFALMGVASILSIIFKIKFMPLIAKSLAPAGIIFTLVSIITGSLWGKPTWGIWWTWDARLTSMVVLLCFYLAYIMTWKFVDNFEKANKISSAICIVG